jgi:hypothetical protein
MPDKKPQKPKSQTPLSGLQKDVRALIRRREDTKKKDLPKSRSPLSGLQNDVNAFIRRRADNQKDIANLAEEVMPIRGGRKQTEILLMMSELENLLLKLNSKDMNVYLAREKLTELKDLLAKNLGIK